MAHLAPIPDVGEAVERLLHDDPDARICVLPQGPQTIAYVAERPRMSTKAGVAKTLADRAAGAQDVEERERWKRLSTARTWAVPGAQAT